MSMPALTRVAFWWQWLEDQLVVFSLVVMTLVTFVYVVLNNVYMVFYWLTQAMPAGWLGLQQFWQGLGDAILTGAQDMSWSAALTKVGFAWLIFLGIAYGVRTATHLGIDVFTKRLSLANQRSLGLMACACCLAYVVVFFLASWQWVSVLWQRQIGAEDLDRFGITLAHIAAVVPVGLVMAGLRYVQILRRMLALQQVGLIPGELDEVADLLQALEEMPEAAAAKAAAETERNDK